MKIIGCKFNDETNITLCKGIISICDFMHNDCNCKQFIRDNKKNNEKIKFITKENILKELKK